jgi:hypothetical protein
VREIKKNSLMNPLSEIRICGGQLFANRMIDFADLCRKYNGWHLGARIATCA